MEVHGHAWGDELYTARQQRLLQLIANWRQEERPLRSAFPSLRRPVLTCAIC
jgi:hypothetical protein